MVNKKEMPNILKDKHSLDKVSLIFIEEAQGEIIWNKARGKPRIIIHVAFGEIQIKWQRKGICKVKKIHQWQSFEVPKYEEILITLNLTNQKTLIMIEEGRQLNRNFKGPVILQASFVTPIEREKRERSKYILRKITQTIYNQSHPICNTQTVIIQIPKVSIPQIFSYTLILLNNQYRTFELI